MALGTASKDIVIKIKGDNKDFNNALKKSDSSMKGFAGKLKQHSGAIKLGLVAIGVAAAAAFALAIKSTISYGEEVDKVRKITGMTAETITSMAYAAEQEHTSLDALQTGWRKLSRAMSDADEGLAESKRTFDALGISIYDNEGQLRSMESMTLEIADAFADMESDTKKAALAQELFGRSGSEMIPFLEMGADEIRSLQEEAKELGIVMSEEMVDNSKRFGDQMTLMTTALKGVAVSLATELLPHLIEFSDVIVGIVKSGWLTRIVSGFMLISRSSDIVRKSVLILINTFAALLRLSVGDIEGFNRHIEKIGIHADRLGDTFTDIKTDLKVIVDGPLKKQKDLLEEISDIQHENEDSLGEQKDTIADINELYSQSIGMMQAAKGVTSSDWANRAADIAAGRISTGGAGAESFGSVGEFVSSVTPGSYMPSADKYSTLLPSSNNINISTGDIVNQGDLNYLTDKIKSAVMAGGE